MKRALIATTLLGAFCHPAMAQASFPPNSPASERACASLDIVSNGRALRPVYFSGSYWVEGHPGAEYSLVLSNRCPYRLLAVPSVDGLDVVSGQPASFASPGYILEPGATVPVDGWRKSGSSVAAFYFSSPRGSYARKMGQGQNVGVIAAAFFRDATDRYLNRRDGEPWGHEYSKALPQSSPAPAAEAASSSAAERSFPESASLSTRAAPSLGTGHGRPLSSPSSVGTFAREPEPVFSVWRRYESRDRLVQMGVLAPPAGPNAFPREPQYAPDPPRHFGR